MCANWYTLTIHSIVIVEVVSVLFILSRSKKTKYNYTQYG